MMYITVQKNAPHGEKKELYWHVGERKPSLDTHETVIEIQADGDELDHVRKIYVNLPQASGRVVLWKDPFAQFIYDNL